MWYMSIKYNVFITYSYIFYILYILICKHFIMFLLNHMKQMENKRVETEHQLLPSLLYWLIISNTLYSSECTSKWVLLVSSVSKLPGPWEPIKELPAGIHEGECLPQAPLLDTCTHTHALSLFLISTGDFSYPWDQSNQPCLSPAAWLLPVPFPIEVNAVPGYPQSPMILLWVGWQLEPQVD